MELDDFVSLAASVIFPLCKPQLWRESAYVHNLLILLPKMEEAEISWIKFSTKSSIT